MSLDKRSHYNRNGVEAKEVIRMVSDHQEGAVTPYQGFCIGNVVKYVMRFPFKGEPVENLKKAKVYLDYLIQDINRENQKRRSREDSTPDNVEVKTEIVEIKGGPVERGDAIVDESIEEEPTKVYVPKPPRPGIPEFNEYRIIRPVEYP